MSTRCRRVMNWLLALALGYLGLVVLVACFQRSLIYLPRRQTDAEAAAQAQALGATPLRAASGEILGWRFTPARAPAGSVLVFHGNAGSALNRDYLAGPIQASGAWEVIVVEYPGYGPRPGSPDLSGILATAETVVGLLATHRPLYVVSESLGAGAGTHLARVLPERIRGLVMFAPYEDLGSVAQSAFPFLPAKWLLRDRFRPGEWLRDYRGPVYVVLADADEVIPVAHGRRLAENYAGPKRLENIPHARHNDIASQTPEWWRGVFEFLESESERR